MANLTLCVMVTGMRKFRQDGQIVNPCQITRDNFVKIAKLPLRDMATCNIFVKNYQIAVTWQHAKISLKITKLP